MFTIQKIPNFPKPMVSSCLLVKLKNSTKTETHYDVLRIPIKATQSEIKSAYYNLSMQYHPDKNKTESAKKTFHHISEAYEVLSNYDKRNKYDRSLNITSKVIEDVKPLVKKSNTKYTKLDPTKFNYEEWARAHYSDSFESVMQAKMNLKMIKENQKTQEEQKDDVFEASIGLAIIITISIFLFFRIF